MCVQYLFNSCLVDISTCMQVFLDMSSITYYFVVMYMHTVQAMLCIFVSVFNLCTCTIRNFFGCMIDDCFIICTGCSVSGHTTPTLNGTTSTNIRIKTGLITVLNYYRESKDYILVMII